jgi:hypothetical protein
MFSHEPQSFGQSVAGRKAAHLSREHRYEFHPERTDGNHKHSDSRTVAYRAYLLLRTPTDACAQTRQRAARDRGWEAFAALGIIAGAIWNASVPDAGSDLSMISAR